MQFYDIVDQNKYQITITKPKSVEELSDMFVTEDELKEMIGPNFYFYGEATRTVILKSVVETEVKKWANKLEASGKRTLVIEDEELLALLKDNYLTDFDDTDQYGRHGDRICYARRYTRVKKKPTKTDVRDYWNHYFPCAFRAKYGCYPPHTPTYNRCLSLFKAFQKIVGWRRVRALLHKDNVKFIRQIWDNPQEYM